MNVFTTNQDPRPEKSFQPVSCQMSAHLSLALLNRVSLTTARQSDRPGCETLLWLLLGVGCVLWPLTQAYQQTSAFVAGCGLERLAVAAVCKGAGAPPCALADTDTATCHGQSAIRSADEAVRPQQTATARSAGQLFSAAAYGAGVWSSTSLR